MTDSTTALPSGTWTIDPAATTVGVSVKNFGFNTVDARLTVRSGTIEVGEDGTVTGVSVVADAGSYDSGNPKRDEHVSNADFLDATVHPDLSFSSDQVVAASGGHRANGSVTVKSVASPLTLDVTGVSVDAGRATFSATGTVDRKAIGVDKMPSFVIGRTLTLTIDCTATAG